MKKEVKIFLIVGALAGIAFAVWYFFVKKKTPATTRVADLPTPSNVSADLLPFIEKTKSVLGSGNVANILERMQTEGKSGVNAFMDIISQYAGDPNVLKDNPRFKEVYEKELWNMWQEWKIKNAKK